MSLSGAFQSASRESVALVNALMDEKNNKEEGAEGRSVIKVIIIRVVDNPKSRLFCGN